MTDLQRRVRNLGFGLLETARGYSLLEPITGTTVRRKMDREELEAWLYEHESFLFEEDPVIEDEHEQGGGTEAVRGRWALHGVPAAPAFGVERDASARRGPYSPSMARPRQRYISRELTHFVGGPDPNDEEVQYETLLSILRDRELRPPGVQPGQTARNRHFQFSDGGSLSDGTMFSGRVVCFCDIPLSDLHIHMQKYGRFGLSFDKRYLATERGASPVFYVAADASPALGGLPNLGTDFDLMAHYYTRLFNELLKTDPDDLPEIPNVDWAELTLLTSQLGFNVFSFIKCFNVETAEADAANYYMEREWRIHGPVAFELEQVRKVIMPRRRFRDFRRDVPDYHGELVAAPSLTAEP